MGSTTFLLLPHRSSMWCIEDYTTEYTPPIKQTRMVGLPYKYWIFISTSPMRTTVPMLSQDTLLSRRRMFVHYVHHENGYSPSVYYPISPNVTSLPSIRAAWQKLFPKHSGSTVHVQKREPLCVNNIPPIISWETIFQIRAVFKGDKWRALALPPPWNLYYWKCTQKDLRMFKFSWGNIHPRM